MLGTYECSEGLAGAQSRYKSATAWLFHFRAEVGWRVVTDRSGQGPRKVKFEP